MATLQQEAQTSNAATNASVAKVAHKLEVLVIPVSDVDRAKEFYANLGWRLDADYDNGSDFRVIQFTPTGSGCSVIFGRNVTAAAPGSAQGLYLIVSDVAAAREELLGRGVKVSDVFHDAAGVYAGPDEPYLFGRLRVSGPDPDHRSYRSFASFHDPDGNGWLFQEITTRLPGRVTGDTRYPSASEFIGGVGGRRPAAGALITTFTAGIPALTKALAFELAPIRVNLIAPGFVDTPLSASLLGDQLDARREHLRTTLPIRRVVGPADIAALAIHLMVNTAVTGATYEIDGGQQLVEG
jgi:NAD(P)-dependent dehydrogenase (short-subunit alcohol dehydrogenase family)